MNDTQQDRMYRSFFLENTCQEIASVKIPFSGANYKTVTKGIFFPETTIQWNLLPQVVEACQAIKTFRNQLTPSGIHNIN